MPNNLKQEGQKVTGIETARALAAYKKAQGDKSDNLSNTVYATA